MPKLPRQQLMINTQFNEDLAEVKTRQLFAGQALGAVIELLEGLIERLTARDVLHADDALIGEFRRAIRELKGLGLDLQPPTNPKARTFQVKCPGCQAVIKAEKDARVERCDWCGHEFRDAE